MPQTRLLAVFLGICEVRVAAWSPNIRSSCGCQATTVPLLTGQSAFSAASRRCSPVTSATISGAARTDQRWGPTVQGPYSKGTRATVRRELIKGWMWSFEQVQGVIYVHIPVRMTVLRLQSGGLFAYAPVAPTAECLRLLDELEQEYGPLQHALLPSLAVEHKGFAAAFGRARPDVQLWAAPSQFSFPLDLPLTLCGFPSSTRLLPAEWAPDATPWASELPWRTLGALEEKVGKFQEIVLFHQPTRALLVCDLLVSVSSKPPAVVAANDLRALLFHARDTAEESVADDVQARERGWMKIALFALYFQCSSLELAAEPDGTFGGALRFLGAAFPAAVPQEMRALGWLGFWPFRWAATWPATFNQLSGGGRPLVPPILQVSVLNREPTAVLDFARQVAEDFEFDKVVPCHFDAPVPCSPRQWMDAFSFLSAAPPQPSPLSLLPRAPAAQLPDADLDFLADFDQQLVASGSIRPPAPKLPRPSPRPTAFRFPWE